MYLFFKDERDLTILKVDGRLYNKVNILNTMELYIWNDGSNDKITCYVNSP